MIQSIYHKHILGRCSVHFAKKASCRYSFLCSFHDSCFMFHSCSSGYSIADLTPFCLDFLTQVQELQLAESLRIKHVSITNVCLTNVINQYREKP